MTHKSPSSKIHGNMSETKKLWRKKNPPDADGNYICWICTKLVAASIMTLDHVASVEEWPEYAKDLSNLRPSHRFCNEERAAKRLAKLRRKGILG